VERGTRNDGTGVDALSRVGAIRGREVRVRRREQHRNIGSIKCSGEACRLITIVFYNA
jgi:hypothetical protein